MKPTAFLINPARGPIVQERALYEALAEGVDATMVRLANFVAAAAQATRVGQAFDDAATARRDVRRGTLAFVLEIPADFSRQAVPGERAGAAQLRIYTSEGNHYASAGFARRFAPEVAQRINTRLSVARWDLVLSNAAGSRQSQSGQRGRQGERVRHDPCLQVGERSDRQDQQEKHGSSRGHDPKLWRPGSGLCILCIRTVASG
jgi:hypothetical protein